MLAVYAATTVGTCQSAEEKHWLPVGLKALEERKFNEAIEPLTKAIKQSSISSSANYHNAVVAISKVTNPEQYFEIKGRNQYVLHSYTARGIAYSNLNDDKKAIEDFTSALIAFTKSAKATCNRGRSYMRLKMVNEAMKDFDAAIKIAPNLAEAYANRAIAYRMLRQNEKAEADTKKAAELRKDPEHEFIEQSFHRDSLIADGLNLNPKNVVLLTESGMVLFNTNREVKAIEQFKKAIQVDPKFFEAHGGLADCYMSLENFDAALACAKKAEKLRPNDGKSLIRIGMIYYNSDRLKEGAPYMRRILKLPAKTAEQFRYRTLCYLGLGDYREALKENEKSLRLEPRHARSWDDRALCFANLKRYSEAIAAQNQSISLKPDFAGAYIHRAQIYLKLHRLEDADNDLDRALALSPKDKEIYRVKGALEAMKGNLELSFADGQTGTNPVNRYTKAITKDMLKKEIARYSKIISTIPSQPAPFYDRAVLNIAMENLSAGIEDLRTFLSLSKWNGRSSSYAASLLVLALRESGRGKEADAVLRTATQRLSAANTVPILELLSGKATEQTLLKNSKSGNTETRDRLFLGIYFWQAKRIPEAKAQLDWVYNKGDQNIDEYVLVSIYRQKLALTPRKELRQFDNR